jgi:tripartite-type tricarboxylate transporter receptor subunit TctC
MANSIRQSRRRAVQAIAAASVSLPAVIARAQANPVRLVVGFAAGGSVDLLARAVGEQLSQQLGRPVIVENKLGAAGRLAVDAVKTAKPDGDTLLVCPQGPLTLFPYVFKNLKYDPFTDLTPVTRLASFDVGIGLGPQSGTDTLPTFLDWAKNHPNQANYGSSGNGTLLHFTGVTLSQLSGVKLTHVPYKGAALAVADLIGGSIPMCVSPMSDLLEHHKLGRLRVAAITSPQRSPLAPDVPTCKELGIDIDVPGWFALYGPAGMPNEAGERLNQLVTQALGTATLRERCLKMGMIAAGSTRAQTLELQRREFALEGGEEKRPGWAFLITAISLPPIWRLLHAYRSGSAPATSAFANTSQCGAVTPLGSAGYSVNSISYQTLLMR